MNQSWGGSRWEPEIIPVEPDPDNTGEGNPILSPPQPISLLQAGMFR